MKKILKSKFFKYSIYSAMIIFAIVAIAKIINRPSLIIAPGKYSLTVQFISDTPGYVNIFVKNDTTFIKGQTISNDSSGYLYLNGHLEKMVPDSFVYVGSINMFSPSCCGVIKKPGKWTFRKIGNRNFFRLKEKEALCSPDTCYYYIDIYL